MVTGRKKLAPTISPIVCVAKWAPALRAALFSPFNGEKVPAGG
jgi:hypothetical protein